MKSVIAQGATVVKAIEEALKKADMPQEFFVKLLEDAQSGFLGFGAKKAKIALFYKKEIAVQRGEGVLRQDSYEGLFNSQALQKQIDNQQKDVGSQSTSTQNQVAKKTQHVAQKPVEQGSQAPRTQDPRAPQRARQSNQYHQRELRPVQPQATVKPIEKIDKPQKVEQRLQDIPQRQLPHPSSDSSTEDRPGYRSRRRSRYYSPRSRDGQGNGESSKVSNPKNNNDSDNS